VSGATEDDGSAAEWRLAENRDRADAYRKDEAAEAALLRMNEALAPLEPAAWSGVVRPTVFVLGLPRSGTTLLGQLLAATLELGIIDGLAARFWLAPCQGVVLSRQVLGETRDSSFVSDLGRGADLRSPHEFSYFWQHWLRIESTDDLLSFGSPRRTVDWPGLRRVVGAIGDTWDRSLMFKTNYAGQFSGHFAATFPAPLFVSIERPPAAVALSILRARRRYYGTSERWWATLPPDYQELVGCPVPDQIAGQVASLRSAYREQLEAVDPEAVVRLDYDELCANPSAAVAAVRERLWTRHRAAVDLLVAPPARFEVSPSQPADAEERAVVEATLATVRTP